MPRQPTSVVAALADALRSDPGRPLVTMYDDATGERVELSVATFDNWVCKLANLVSVEWELGPDDSVRIDLPPHWQAMVAAVAAWTAGVPISLDRDAAVAVTVAGPDWNGDRDLAGQVLACSLRPFGQGFTTPLPAGWLDWALEVPSQPDALVLPQPVRGSDAALVTASGVTTHEVAVERGLAAAAASGLEHGGRLITDLDPSSPAGIDVGLLAPLATGSSVVLLVNAAPARRQPIAAQERVTCARWSSGP